MDGANPPNERYKYKGTFNAFRRIIKEEGLGVLWIGWEPAVFRCMVLNVTQIVLYKNSKELLLHTGIALLFYPTDNVSLPY